jgi:hypothetical protein
MCEVEEKRGFGGLSLYPPGLLCCGRKLTEHTRMNADVLDG